MGEKRRKADPMARRQSRPPSAAKEARREIGYQLSLIQARQSASDWKPMPIVGAGVIETRIHADGEYRVFYVAKFEDAVHVFACFRQEDPEDTLTGH